MAWTGKQVKAMTSPSRAAFEKWAADFGFSTRRSEALPDTYYDSPTSAAWDAWQACAESLSSKPGAWAERAACCRDCGLSYTDAAWDDFCVSDDDWAALTAADDAPLLCVRCMSARAKGLGLTLYGEFRSGPFCDPTVGGPVHRHAPASYDDGWKAGIEAATNAQPSTAENPNEDAYQRGRCDGIMEYGRAIRALLAPPKET